MPELTREQLLVILKNDWATYGESIQRFSPEAQAEFLVPQGYGCLRDLLAHILVWWEEGQRVINNLYNDPDSALPDYDVDAFNARAVERFHSWSEPAVLEAFEQARANWIRLIESLPDSAFQNKKITHRLSLELVFHMQEHALSVKEVA
jgi:hypothetical protein